MTPIIKGTLAGMGLLALLLPLNSGFAQTDVPGGAINQNLGDMDYGVCRGTDVKCFHDWPRAKTSEYRVLLYTHTAGPRHEDLGKPLGDGLNPPLDDSNVVQHQMLKLMAANGIKLDYTEDNKVMLGLTR